MIRRLQISGRPTFDKNCKFIDYLTKLIQITLVVVAIKLESDK